MSNYTKATNFAIKDTLAPGNVNKIVRGTEIDAEFTAISTAVTTKADLANPTFTGTANFANINFSGTLTGIVDGGTY